MLILVLNAGSSSLKYQLLDMEDETVLVRGSCERIGREDASHKYCTYRGQKFTETGAIASHMDGLRMALDKMTGSEDGVIHSISEIDAVGHRIAQGGSLYRDATMITERVRQDIGSLIPLAPLHNGAQLQVIEACGKLMGAVIPQCAVFDTAFHATMPSKAYMYGIPYKLYEEQGIRKYGFHGTSHRYVSGRCAELMGKPVEELKIITCHIGNGSSVAAVKYGKVIDTSMGFTPLDGLLMGTRCGSIDPSIPLFLIQKYGYTPEQLDELFNRKSGLLGISGISSDDREVVAAELHGNKRAALAHDMLYYQISKMIGSYIVAMHGLDAVVFTAGLGENQYRMRERVCESLAFMGVSIRPDENKQLVGGRNGKISDDNSRIAVYVIGTNEELLIARDTRALLS